MEKDKELYKMAMQLADGKKLLKQLQQDVAVLESKVMNYMLENNQTQMALPTGELILQQTKLGMADKFVENFGELDLISQELFGDIYTPESTKTVPAKINLAKIRKLKKYGDEVWEKANECIVTQRFNLKYEERE